MNPEIDNKAHKEIQTLKDVARFLKKSTSWVYKHWRKEAQPAQPSWIWLMNDWISIWIPDSSSHIPERKMAATGGPRKIPMTRKLKETLQRRYRKRDIDKPWVFCHTYTSIKTGEKRVGPIKDRKKSMKTLCGKANVRYFRFHAIRHSGVSMTENSNVPIGSIQRGYRS